MHELPIIQSILNISLKEAKKKNASKILKVKIILGEFTGFVDESIYFYWEIATKNTIAQDSQILITRKKGELKCLTCNFIFKNKSENDLCPQCKSHKIKITKGNQLIIKSIELDI